MNITQPNLFDIPPEDDSNEFLWMAAHGAQEMISPSEVPELKKGVEIAFRLLSDGLWRTRAWIEENHPAQEAMRRVRDLRPHLEKIGWEVQRRRAEVGRVFEYRIARKGLES